MAKGKSTYQTWYCSACKRGNYITTYNKREEDTLKEKKKFCRRCRKHLPHKAKDSK